MADGEAMVCEVAYARPDRQFTLSLTVPPGTTAGEALARALDAGLRASCPEIVADRAVLGIFGKVVTAQTPLKPGDRLEIYRPLKADPRVARRARTRYRR